MDQELMLADNVSMADVDNNTQNYQDFMASQLLGGMTQADLTADMPPMQRRNPMERPPIDGGPMQIPKPPMGPMGGPFDGPYDPNAPNTPPAQMPRPPQRNPLDTDVEYEQPGPTQIPRPDQRGPANDPFNRDTRGQDGQFPLGLNQQLDNSMQGMNTQGFGLRGGAGSGPTAQGSAAYQPQRMPQTGNTGQPLGGFGDAFNRRREQGGGGLVRSNFWSDRQGDTVPPQGGRPQDREDSWRAGGFLVDPQASRMQQGSEANSRTDGTYSPQASRMQQGPEATPEQPTFGQEGYGDMVRQRRAEQGGPKTLADLRNQAQGRGQIDGIAYGKSGAPQMTLGEVRNRQSQIPQTSQFRRDPQGSARDSYGNRMSRMPQQNMRPSSPKPTGPTTVNLRTPNQGVKQQFTDRQNRALGNTMQTTSQRANQMRNAASRYRRPGLQTTANRAKPRTSLPQLYGN
tara:strand:- start:1090 stop:2460 length:1371 start_codon:yes stop_codon:yes gene_type:complete